MHIATWLVAVPWRNSFIGAFSGEFQNLRSDASSGKRTSAVRAPTGHSGWICDDTNHAYEEDEDLQHPILLPNSAFFLFQQSFPTNSQE